MANSQETQVSLAIRPIEYPTIEPGMAPTQRCGIPHGINLDNHDLMHAQHAYQPEPQVMDHTKVGTQADMIPSCTAWELSRLDRWQTAAHIRIAECETNPKLPIWQSVAPISRGNFDETNPTLPF